MAAATRSIAVMQSARRLARDLERRRNAQGLTRFVLSQRLRVPVGMLEDWENGRTFPDAADLMHWMKELGCRLVIAESMDEARS